VGWSLGLMRSALVKSFYCRGLLRRWLRSF
jgi:hypothetical protein